MTVSGMVKSSFIDFPGLVACVLFMPGCNYNCYYCHNRSLIDGTHEIILPGCVDDFLKKRVGMLDGVVISGGEPTMQPGLISFLKSIKDLGYKIKLDTNGSSPLVMHELIKSGLCDYYAVDYKAPAARYKEICGPYADADAVQNTIRLLNDLNAGYEVRTTVVPRLSGQDLVSMAKELPPLKKYVLNRFRKPERYMACHRELVDQPPYSKAQMEEFADRMRPFQPNVTL